MTTEPRKQTPATKKVPTAPKVGVVAEASTRMQADKEQAQVNAMLQKQNDALSVVEPALEPKASIKKDLSSHELYLNRELTWLNFNRRVLAEAQNESVPLLEQVKFLAIAGSNLDEFFMKRIGGLKQQVAAGVHQLTVDGRSPQQQLTDCLGAVEKLLWVMHTVYLKLIDKLKNNGIVITSYDLLEIDDKRALREAYFSNIFPLITPLAMDPAHPFPFISNLSLNLLVTLRYKGDAAPVMNRIKVPLGAGVPRFQKVGNTNTYVPLEQVMSNNLDLLFPDMDIETCEIFRVTRNANTEVDVDQAEDLLSEIETELRYRKFAPFVRLEVRQPMESNHRGMLATELGLNEEVDVFESDMMPGLRDLMEIASIDIPELCNPDHHPITNVKLLEDRSIFHLIRENGDILLQHPYESFANSVERFVREASRDPKVRAIKMTLYRTSEGTAIIEYLLDAARNGKQVSVAVELKARFDEAANIKWASRLEEAGVHVSYGVVGLKTHSKIILVVRRDYTGLRRYIHVGTGNYHAGTARLYCDLGLLTCDDEIGHDATELFNYLTSGCKPSRNYRKLLTAPKVLKKMLLAKIEREIGVHSEEAPGLIRLKTNAIEDADITRALYQASQAGVKVELIVRDTCRLRPGIAGLSDNVTVVSIVGRFLEHSRIYYFHNGGQEEYFIGSADLMTRNLESRVEVVAPVENPILRKELKNILDVQLNDIRNAWEMQPSGGYVKRLSAGKTTAKGCQDVLINQAEKRRFEANRLRNRKPRAIASHGGK